MKRIVLLTVLSLSLLVLTACGDSAAPEVAVPAMDALAVTAPEIELPEVEVPQAEVPAPGTPSGAGLDETVADEQGTVSVTVTPRNIDAQSSVLEFEVAMNTHSVDLSMNLAELATLSTDTGTEIAAIGWDAPEGGHHVSGVLSFPAGGEDAELLEGATTLTLTLVNVDAPERTFTWSLK